MCCFVVASRAGESGAGAGWFAIWIFEAILIAWFLSHSGNGDKLSYDAQAQGGILQWRRGNSHVRIKSARLNVAVILGNIKADNI